MPLPRARLLTTLLTLLIAGLSSVAPSAEPASEPGTMIIFDGSGSMWGRLDGDKRAKLDVARDALRPLLEKAPSTARLGLMSFGHRRSGDCGDIEVIAQPATGDITRITGPLDKLNPRGKGPLSGAIREAAKALAGAPNAAIILIHDNADNCRQDSCEAASEIAAAAPKLRIFLVPLGVDTEELDRSVCMAKLTGGDVYEARDASSVPAALAGALAAALRLNPANPTAAADGKSAPPPLPVVPGLRLEARLGATPLPEEAAVRWRIAKSGEQQPLFEGVGNPLTLPLDPGPYAIEATTGDISARAAVTVADGPTSEATVAFEAASVRLAVADVKDGPASLTAMITLTSAAPGQSEAAARPVWIGWARDAQLILPPGSYRARVTDSLIEHDDTFTLATGDALTRPIVLGAGHLEVTALAKADDRPLDGVRFLIAKDDPDTPGGRREIARSAALHPMFTLPPGTYYVTARYGAAEVRQQVGVSAGDDVKQRIVMGLAHLTVSADALAASKPVQPADPSARPAISTRVFSLSGEEREVARSTATLPEFTLAAGRYRVEAAIGGLNVKAVQEVTLDPGAARQVSLRLESGVVTLKLASTPPASAGVTFEVVDGKGGLVVRTQARQPRLVLAPGRYTVRCDIDDRRIERSIDVTSDPQPRTIEFAQP